MNMKKMICWMTAAASLAALAESVPTYHRLTWRVPAEALSAVGARYANLYAVTEGGAGERVGGDGRATFGELELTAATVVQGDGGWGLTAAEVAGAVYRVELLNAERGLVATSSGVSYETLVANGSFEVNYAGSAAPVNGTEAYAFTEFTVDDGGANAYLGGLAAAYGRVMPRTDADGNIVDHLLTLTNDVTGPLVLAGNVGLLTIDLNGHSVTGTNAVNGTTARGGNAIEIAGLLDNGCTNVTKLALVNDAVPLSPVPGPGDYAGVVAGGNGADGCPGTAGGYGVWVDGAISNVTVTAAANVTLRGGNAGNSYTGPATAAVAAVGGSDASSSSAGGTVSSGATGTAWNAWGWAKCAYAPAAELPAGTTQGGDTLYFWKRSGTSTNLVCYDFGVLSNQTVTGGEIHLYGGLHEVDQFVVPAGAGNLTFVGADGDAATELLADPYKSVFRVTSEAGETRGWTNITFRADVRPIFGEDGCAIRADGGAVAIAGCCFTNCAADHLGGAVCLTRLRGDSSIAESEFLCNAAGADNGCGGALYASAWTNGAVTLTLADDLFRGNEAVRGGAVSTQTTKYDDENPIALAIADTAFENNAASWYGGAIDAEGDVRIEEDATWDDRGATVFAGNFAGWGGGAVCVAGATLVDSYGSVVEWLSAPVTLSAGRGTVFSCNSVSNAAYAAGGAVEIMNTGTVFRAEGVAFASNTVYGALEYGVYGGAVNSAEAPGVKIEIGECTFCANTVSGGLAYPDNEEYSLYYYGGALFAADAETTVSNSTFRGSNIDAVTLSLGSAVLLNDVFVGNDLTSGENLGDVFLNGMEAEASYCAYGSLATSDVELTEFANLSNRVADVIYAGDSLRLNPVGFNPVAALGYPQTDVRDFDGVVYGSLSVGTSMGAYETPTAPVVVRVDGEKVYDALSSSNGCAWAWRLTDTNGADIAWGDLTNGVDLAELFTIKTWEHETADAATYTPESESPLRLTAEYVCNAEDVKRWVAQGFVTFGSTGVIARRPVAMGGLTIEATPVEYPYTGAPVLANVVVRESLPGGDATLEADVDYGLTYAGNVAPTSNAVATATMVRNWIDATNVTYWITAYFVEYTFDDKVREDLTLTYGETSGVAVATDRYLPAAETVGYALDDQYSETNGVVRRIDATNGLLRLRVKYCTDENGDRIPDKYQRRTEAKVVNGLWTTDADGNPVSNGDNVLIWTTLFNSDGKWDANGSGNIGSAPTAGTSPLSSFTTGGWLGFTNGVLTVFADVTSVDVSKLSVPFVLYAYSHAATGGSTGGRGGLGSRGRGGSTTVPTKSLLEQYSAALSVVDATVTNGQYVISAKLVVNDTSTGAVATDVPLRDAAFRVLMAENLGDDWEEKEFTAEQDGKIYIDLTGKSGFYKIGL